MRGIAVLLLLIGAAACSDDSAPERPAITELTGPSSAVSVMQGFAAKSVVAIRRNSLFDGEVHLTAENLPQGLLVSFSPATMVAPAELTEMTVSALWNIAAGPHSFTVRASGDGVDSKVITVSVTVTIPGIGVSAANQSISLPQGNTLEVPLTVTREGGFTGSVSLILFGLPAGVTGVITPVVVESGVTSAVLTLTASLATETGPFSLMLRASSQGLTDVTLPLQLSVEPATTPAILVAAQPPFMQLTGFGSVSSTIRIQRFANYTGTVSFSISGLPDGVEASVSPLQGSETETQLTLSTSQDVISMLYPLVLHSSGPGISEVTTGMTLQGRPLPQFNLTYNLLNPDLVTYQTSRAVTVARSETVSLTMVVFRVSQFDLPVTLTVTGLPEGVTLSLPAVIASSTANSQQFNAPLNVGANATPGTYTIIVRGDAGPFTREIELILTVPGSD